MTTIYHGSLAIILGLQVVSLCQAHPDILFDLLLHRRGGAILSSGNQTYCATTRKERTYEIYGKNRPGEEQASWMDDPDYKMSYTSARRRTFSDIVVPSPPSQSRQQLDYTDVLQCSSPQWVAESSDDMEDSLNDNDLFGSDDDSDSENIHNSGTLEGRSQGSENKPAHSPIVYKYYGRSRSRANADSIPFILLGPNVDHWKAVAQVLAARGFRYVELQKVCLDHAFWFSASCFVCF
jgi:hypothetical protein